MQELLSKLAGLGIQLNADGDQLEIIDPNEQLTEDLITEIRAYKIQLLNLLTAGVSATREAQIDPITPQTHYQLSHAQERMYFLYQLDTDSVVYNMPYVARLKGELQVDKLEAVFNQLIIRHESLRTYFEAHEGKPVQVVADQVAFQIGRVHSSGSGTTELIKDFIQPFDLGKGPLLRADIVTLPEQEYLLMIDMHHIICDGISQDILVADLLQLYNDQALDPLTIQYKDFAAWQRAQEGAEDADQTFWLGQFAEEFEVLDLPADHKRSSENKTNGKAINFEIGAAATQRLRAMAQEQGVTTYMQLLAIYNVLVARLSHQQDVIIGTPVAGRDHADLEKIMGMFVNTLALRNYPKGQLTFLEFLKEVQQNTLACFDHQHYPFEQLVDELGIQRDSSRNPLFDTMFVFQNLGAKQLQIPGLTINPLEFDRNIATFDLTLTAGEGDEHIGLRFEYATSLFERKTIERFIRYFHQILNMVLEQPNIKLSEIELLDEEEKQLLLESFNTTESDYPKELTVVDMFEEQVAQQPTEVAVVYEELRSDYQSLNARANQLASVISSRLDGSGHRIAILCEPSIDAVASILGVLKSGNTYIPLSSNLPANRINFIIEDAGAELVLTDEHTADTVITSLPVDRKVNLSLMDIDVHATYESQSLTASDIIYIIYTSGSTGKPKGVEVKHGGIANMAHFYHKIFDVHQGVAMSQVANLSFDAAAFELFPCLVHGGRLHIVNPDIRLDPEKMKDWLIHNEINLTFQPTALAEKLLSLDWPETPGALRVMNIAGDKLAVPSGTIVPFDVFNLYGPTEDSIWTTYKSLGNLTGATEAGNSIGRPTGNKKVLITNEAGLLQPINVPGELCIAGDGLARGYLNNEQLTREKFVANMYAPDSLMYRSGDLAKWLPNGEIEFLGRVDHQVKIRGFRIEIGEIENQMVRIPGVKEAVVLVMEKDDNKFLVGYYTASVALEGREIINFLTSQLPDYMIPTHFVVLDSLPLTANGKVDRRALPEPDLETRQEAERSLTATESQLVQIWSEILNLEQEKIGLDVSFFAMGGQSLMAGNLTNKISQVFDVTVPIKVIFDYQTVSQLATYLEQQDKLQSDHIAQAEPKEYYKVSSAQKRMFFLYEFDRESLAYNMPNAVILEGALDQNKLNWSFEMLVARHESFRTQIELVEGEIVQRILPTVDFSIEVQQAERGEIGKYFKAFIQPFDLSQGPLIRAGVLALEDGDHVLMLDMHHIVCDGVSFDLLLKDFMRYYNNEAPAELTIQYKDYAEWQQGEVFQKKLQLQKQFWLNDYAELPSPLELPTDFVRPAVPDFSGDDIDFELSTEVTSQLREIAGAHQSTMFMTLLAIFKIYLSKLSNQEDLVVGTSTAGRAHADLESVIGMFINTVTIRNQLDHTRSFSDFLNQVQHKVLACFENQSYQYEDLIEQLNVDRDTARNPLFDVTFDLNNFEEAKLSLQDLSLKPYKIDYDTSQFDLSLTGTEVGDKLSMNLRYSTALFRRETIQKFVSYFRNVVNEVIRDVNISIADISLLGKNDRNLLLHDFNDSFRNYPDGETFPAMFSEMAKKFPDRIALSDSQDQLTYQELDALSNRMASYLRSKGLEQGQIIPLILPRGVALIACMLGIQKAGYVFVAIDIDHPLTRVQGIIDDCLAKLVITDATFGQSLQQSGEELAYEVTVLENRHDARALFTNYSSEDVQTTLTPDDITYLIYTSGSTGKPKGVLLHQRGMINHFRGLVDLMELDEEDCLAQTAECSFDIFVVQALLCLMVGGRTEVVQKEVMLDASRFSQLIDEKEITVVELVPTVLKFLLEDGEFKPKADHLRWLISCGEKLTQYLSETWYGQYPWTKIVNAYGPAEASDDVTAYVVPTRSGRETNHHVPIGKPLPNVKMYILDKNQRLCPIGVKGEICISGVAVGKGYWRNEAQTQKKFVPNPYFEEQGTDHPVIYRTGDTGYWQQDGNIVFLGRMDTMVKVRGARIELGEVEAVVLKVANVEQVVVEVREAQLCCYYTSREGEEIENIREQLKDLLPDFMMPTFLVHMPKMPLTGNGKIDRRALPDPDLTSGDAYEAPVSELETQLVQIWSRALEIDPAAISTTKSFFELGGHSLKAVVVLNHVNKEIGSKLKLKDLFVKDTVQTLARFIELNNWLLADEVGDLEGEELII